MDDTDKMDVNMFGPESIRNSIFGLLVINVRDSDLLAKEEYGVRRLKLELKLNQ